MTTQTAEQTVANLIADINAASSLPELRDALNALEGEFYEHHWNSGEPKERVEDHVDLCELETFGGECPGDATNVWSWDEDSVLTAATATTTPWYIETREEWEG
jgi:hypothetical protein